MKTMPQSTKEEKYRWIRPILDKDISIVAMSKVCPFSERSLKYWIESFRKYGVDGLENKSRRPKTNPNETPIWQKERALGLRKETKKCALKLRWDLAEEGIFIHERTIGKFIKAEGLTRKYRVRKIKYKYVRVPLKPGELIEIDVKYVPQKLQNKQYFQYTAIDVATRWRYLGVYEEQTKGSTVDFLGKVIGRFPHQINGIKTDNHATFTNRYSGSYRSDAPFPKTHLLDEFCKRHDIIHYLIDPGKPAQNGTVERSHRSDQETFYNEVSFTSAEELQYKLRLWNMYYNDLKHCGLNGRTPNQALGLF